jgi:RecB family exonuclease
MVTVLNLDLHSMHRDEYVAWLASGPLLDPATNERARTTRWDQLTRAAGLVADGSTFVPTLDAFIAQRRIDLAATSPDDGDAGKRRAISRDIDDASALRGFTATFLTDLVTPEEQPWSAWVAWIRSVVRTYLGPESRRRAWPDREANAALRIDAILEALGNLGPESASRATFGELLGLELDESGEAIGRFGTGVFVGRVSDATGSSFRHLTILGMTDGQFPAVRRDDPLLPDRARRAGGLTTRADRRGEDRHAFLATTAASATTICSFPVADPRRQRKALPSRWLVHWASEQATAPLGAEALCGGPGRDWLEVVPSFARGLHAGPALHRHDAELAALALGAPPADPETVRTLAVAHARRADYLTAFEGDVGPHPAMLTAASISPTSLERWARCPRSFFFEKVLGLTDGQRPEALDTIRADERGSLVHGVLDRFVRESRPRATPHDRWDETDKKLLDTIFEEECDQRVIDGRIGRPVRWLVEQRRLRRRLHAFLDQDTIVRSESGLTPRATELPFGVPDAAQGPVQLPGLPALHGVADRVDASPDGSAAAVYDYKTGTPAAYKAITAADPTAHGTRLQLPVYALAAQQHTGARRVRAAYWFITEGDEPTQVHLDLDDRVMEAFAATVTTIMRGIEAGLFPAVPGPRVLNGHAHCTICPFDRICPTNRAQVWEHVQIDPRLAPLLALGSDDVDEVQP